MNKELKEIVKKSQETLKEATDKAENFIKDFSSDSVSLWAELKSKIVDVEETLKDVAAKAETKTDEAIVDSELGMMEAKQDIQKIEKSVHAFVQEHKNNTTQEIDIVKLRAHLAQMDAVDISEEANKKIRHELAQNKADLKLDARKVAEDVHEVSKKIKNLFT